MINMSDIAKALQAQLQDDSDIEETLRQPIVRGDYVNEDPGRTPWMGIYRGKSRFDPWTLGDGADNWKVVPQIKIVAQVTSFRSGEDCEELMEAFVKQIISAAFTDMTLGGTVDMITGVSAEPQYIETEKETLFFQTTIITLELEVATS